MTPSTISRPHGARILGLFLGGLLFVSGLLGRVIAQPAGESGTEDTESATVSDLESYQDMAVKSDSRREYWMKMTYDGEWIGWTHVEIVTLQTYREDASEPFNIHRYSYELQVAPHLVRQNLEDQIRNEVEKQKKEAGIDSRQVNKIVKKRVQSRFDQLQAVTGRKSVSSTIYLNKDRSFREAKYGFSAPDKSSFTLYLKPEAPGSRAITALVPDEVPQTLSPPQGRPIVNPPLAAKKLLDDRFQQSAYQFLFLSGTRKKPLTRAQVKVLDSDWRERKIGDKKYETRHLKLTLTNPDTGTTSEEWWIGREGTIRQVKLLPSGQQNRDPITLIRAPRKEAMHGLTFVFARRGRRDPFKPVWPKEKPEEVTKKPDEKEICKDYAPKDLFSEAREIVFEKAPRSKKFDHEKSRIRFQRTLTRRFKAIMRSVEQCGDQREKRRIRKLQKQLKEAINIGAMILSIAEDHLESARRAFEQRFFDKIEPHEKAILDWQKRLPEDAEKQLVKRYKETLTSVRKLKKRAQIQKRFLNNAPRIHGIVSSEKKQDSSLTLGIDLLGNRMQTRMNVSVPSVRAVAIIEATGGGSARQKSRSETEEIELEGLGSATVQTIHQDGVVFKYKGESIKVPLIRVNQTLGGGS